MEVKNSLLMPKTNFEMRGNLAKKEPVLVEKWSKEHVYEKMNEGKDLEFMLHDGSPYANEQLSLICASLGIHLIHAKPYSPKRKG